jgi:hypothetical protein
MDNTLVGEVIDDLDRRLRFLTNLDAMLEPFRKLKAGEQLDLEKAFEFCATGSGNRTPAQLDRTIGDWGTPCFDLHLLYLSGVQITPAEERVAAVHNKSADALRSAYQSWSKHRVRKETLRRGDDHARERLFSPKYQALLATAYPALAAAPRPHRPHRPA